MFKFIKTIFDCCFIKQEVLSDNDKNNDIDTRYQYCPEGNRFICNKDL